MKELTIEEKAKRYDEVVDRLRYAFNSNRCTLGFMNEILHYPRESEDERIRKELIEYFRWNVKQILNDFSNKECISWLEKQGEQKLPIEKLPSEMKTIGESLGFTTQEECDEHNQMVSDLIMSDGNEIKPKFKVGDTIRLKNSTAEYTIESISGGCYHGRGWGLNIIDADKSGDYVLVEQKPAEWKQENVEELSEFENAMMHIGYSFFGKRGGLDPNDTSSVKVQAQYLLELAQKSAEWSEEDERNLNEAILLIETGTISLDKDNLINWLISLKQRIGG